jgi:dipeptidyl aminopeptidase/acylaminoacyl peptidase
VISDTPEPPNAFLRWISLSDLTGIWNGTAALEARLWKARADGSSRLLHPSLLVSWKALDLVQPPRLAPNQSYWIAVSNRALSGDPLDPALPCSNLWKVSIDGTQWTPLTTSTDAGEDNLDPAISPDSASIAFASKQKLPASPLSFNLWTISASGSSLTARTQETEAGVDSREPAFSPSGAQLVFSSLKRIAADLPASYNLWKLTLATDTATPFSATLALGSDRRQARFSNDGTKIIYVSNRPLTQGGSSTASMNLWSTSSQQLQETALTLNTSANQDISAPEFSGNDRYIAYESLVPISGTSSASRNIWVLDSVSSTHTPITRNTDPGLSSRLLPGSTW